MKRLILGTLVMGVVLSGCTSGNQPAPTPQTPVTSAPMPAPATTQPQPAPTPTIDPSPLPSVSGWSERPQTVDPEAPSADTAWASGRDVDDILAIWTSYACAESGSLPKPRRVVEGTYHTEDGHAAVVEVATFPNAADARAFRKAYLAGSLECGAARLTDDSITRPIDGSTWTEVVVVDCATMKLAIVEHKLDPAGVAVLISRIA